MRLTPVAHEMGLISPERWQRFTTKRNNIEAELSRLGEIFVHPRVANIEQINALLDAPLTKEATGIEMLRRPDMTYAKLLTIDQYKDGIKDDPEAALTVEIECRYKGYIDRQLEEIAKLQRNEETIIPDDFDYSGISGLSNEVIQKLNNYKPNTLGQASRISGITPAAISILLVYLKKHSQAKGSTLPGGVAKDSLGADAPQE